VKTLRLVAAWPSTISGFSDLLKRMARKVQDMSGGSLRLEVVFADQSKKSALQIFDSVASGEFDVAHGTSYYWTGRSPAFNFFSTVPFGMMAVEHYSWLRYGGGHALWTQLCAPSGVVPLPCGNSGVQMGGWMREPILSLASL
jgi:TRAP-type mannitol/chloroaromatic compound transport system substrate-binding protein